jgi:hypothetical protein
VRAPVLVPPPIAVLAWIFADFCRHGTVASPLCPHAHARLAGAHADFRSADLHVIRGLTRPLNGRQGNAVERLVCARPSSASPLIHKKQPTCVAVGYHMRMAAHRHPDQAFPASAVCLRRRHHIARTGGT